MNTKFKIALAVVAGAALGAAAMQGLHAQADAESLRRHRDGSARCRGRKPRIRRLSVRLRYRQPVLDRSARPGGRVVAIEGTAPQAGRPSSEWDSLEQAQAFYSSKAWTDLAPQRDKAIKTIRRYIVEAGN